MRRVLLAECSEKCLVLELRGSSHQNCVPLHRGQPGHLDGSHPPKTLASFMVTEFSLESSLAEGIGIDNVFLIKL